MLTNAIPESNLNRKHLESEYRMGVAPILVRAPLQLDRTDFRNFATFSPVIGVLRLPQLLRMKLTTSATSWSFSRHAKEGIANCAGVALVLGVSEPSSTIVASDIASGAMTAGFPASRGKTRSYPNPSGRWQAAQLSR